MLKDKIRDIEILYLEEDSDVIDAVKLVIDRNYQAFLSYLKGKRKISLYETDEKDVYDMHDFEVEFYKILRHFMDCTMIKDILDNASLVDWYLYNFADHNNNILTNVDIMYELSDSELAEVFTLLIRYRYYRENGTIEEFLKNHLSTRDVDIVFEWLQDKTRFPLYNALISMAINEISTDEYVFKNLGRLYLILVDEIKKKLDCNVSFSFQELNMEEIDHYMLEFFEFIKAPPTWKEKYLELRRENRLIELNEEDVDLSDQNMHTSFFMEEDIPKIRLIKTGRIDDFTALVHEFIHYLNYDCEMDFTRFVILELPSIYFEIMGAYFLVKKGYSDDIIKFVYFIHHYDNYKCSVNTSILVYRVLDFINNKDTNLEREFNDIINQGERSIRLGTYELFSDDVDEIVSNIKDHFDYLNKKFLNYGANALTGIQYILAMLIIDNIDIEKALSLMIDVGENIDCYSLESILRLCDIDIFGDICKKYLK